MRRRDFVRAVLAVGAAPELLLSQQADRESNSSSARTSAVAAGAHLQDTYPTCGSC